MRTYKCAKCGHRWKAGLWVFACPKCGSLQVWELRRPKGDDTTLDEYMADFIGGDMP